jgi:hypothetical protein
MVSYISLYNLLLSSYIQELKRFCPLLIVLEGSNELEETPLIITSPVLLRKILDHAALSSFQSSGYLTALRREMPQLGISPNFPAENFF